MPLFCFVSTASPSWQLSVVQTPSSVSALVGSNVTLSCRIQDYGTHVFARITWNKGGPSGTTIHPAGDNPATITSLVHWSNTNSTIRLLHVDIPQEGIYHCVASFSNGTNITGKGTELSVQVRPRVPALHVESQDFSDTLNLTCTSGGFYPSRVNITWVIDGNEFLAPEIHVIRIGVTYNVSSVLSLKRGKTSEVYCQIQHGSLESLISSNKFLPQSKGGLCEITWILLLHFALTPLVTLAALTIIYTTRREMGQNFRDETR
ncbi:tyrosine-protein phosphatase non-receptor type substrate 1-like [Latimeria chalumnae]|uniref:tyrosine-protein phosphatase non-receptor type substrate 1-like n=1 Tax=Latimeria chalumnae TaxID=7897 RepID=UPI00313D4908